MAFYNSLEIHPLTEKLDELFNLHRAMLEAGGGRRRTRIIHSVVSRFVSLNEQMQVSLQSVGQYNPSLSPDGEQGQNWIDVQMEM